MFGRPTLGQQNNALDMPRMRKHVHRLHLFHPVAVFAKKAEVARQRLGVAGDIDDPLRRKGGRAFEERQIAARARRVHEQNVDPVARFCRLGHEAARVGAKEARVGGVVQLCVLLGVAHGVGVELHADHPLGLFGGAKADCADAAIGVQHRFAAGQRGIFDRLAVEHLGLHRVDLIKRPRRDPKAAAAQVVFNVALAEENELPLAEHEARFCAVDALDHRGDFRMTAQKLVQKGVLFRKQAVRRDQHDHHFAR